jgi:RecB family endonuclease NucS
LTISGKKKLNHYDQIFAKFEKSGPSGSVAAETITDIENAAGTEFALEEQLRDYLAENLFILEPGLALWPVENGDAVEYQVDDEGPSRRIDILAKDRDGLPVVIELKVSRGHERTVGQALYYRSRIKQRFGATKVRVFIVASEISRELKGAASEVPDVLLFEYALAVKVTAVKP